MKCTALALLRLGGGGRRFRGFVCVAHVGAAHGTDHEGQIVKTNINFNLFTPPLSPPRKSLVRVTIVEPRTGGVKSREVEAIEGIGRPRRPSPQILAGLTRGPHLRACFGPTATRLARMRLPPDAERPRWKIAEAGRGWR